MTSMITTCNLCFAFANTWIVQDVNLSIPKGAFVGIFGPNGGGKTTFCKLLLGLLTPSKGEILIQGKSPKANSHQMSYVPQSIHRDRLFPITAEEVVQMGALRHVNLFGLLPKEYKEKALFYLERVGMIAYRHTVFGKLSGGQAQRILIARALLEEGTILVLDESTAGIDPKAEEEILSFLFSLKKTLTILMVTHDLQTILQAADLLLCVHKEIHVLSPSQVCEHFGLGLYHSPALRVQKP